MKKYIIIGGCVAVLIIFAGWWALSKANLFVQKEAILEGLTHDVAAFYGENKRLPANWEEFVAWSEKNHTDTHWTAEELNPRFALKWGAQVTPSDSRDEKIFIVLDPKFKDIEPYANGRLHDRCSVFDTSGSH
jgi:hypothetical protein